MKPVAGHALFYPAAAAYALLVLPVSVYAMTGHARLLPGLSFPAGHAHEMLFGFALAAVAGNQLGPASAPRRAGLLGLWLLARASFVLAPHSTAAAAANAAFAALLALQIAPRLLGAAKKWRNQALPLVLVAICVAAAAFPAAPEASLAAAVLLFALLMLFMGGRIIAPAIAGQFYRQGGKLDARVQPRIEAALILAMAIALASALAGGNRFTWLSAAATGAAGLLAAARLLRWRPWAMRARPDLLCLVAGYGWVALGLALYGASLALGAERTVALHLITVGGIGTLTLNVMAMTALLKARRDPSRARLPVWCTVLIGAATLCRAFAGPGFGQLALLEAAAALWSAAFGLLLVLRVRNSRNFRRSRPLNDR